MIIGTLAVLGQGLVIYLVYKMTTFAKQYGKPWAKAFWIFNGAMSICFLRRVAVFLWTIGIDGHFKDAIVWYDRYVSNPILTCLYLIFILMLVKWWTKFFGDLNGLLKEREDAVTDREDAVTIREDTQDKKEGK
jgi:hypothetical protein